MKRKFGGVLAVLALAATPLTAQTVSETFATGRELLRSPQHYLGQSITIKSGFCVYDKPNVVCFGKETPFEVKARMIGNARILAKLKETCGDDLPGKEHDPTPACAFTFRFVPTSVTIGTGDYVLHDRVQSNKRLVLFDADVLEPNQ